MWLVQNKPRDFESYEDYKAGCVGPPVDFDSWLLRQISEARKQMAQELARTDIDDKQRAALKAALI